MQKLSFNNIDAVFTQHKVVEIDVLAPRPIDSTPSCKGLIGRLVYYKHA